MQHKPAAAVGPVLQEHRGDEPEADAAPFLCLVWFDVTQGAQCGAYCASTVVAMLGLMYYRRSEYSTDM